MPRKGTVMCTNHDLLLKPREMNSILINVHDKPRPKAVAHKILPTDWKSSTGFMAETSRA